MTIWLQELGMQILLWLLGLVNSIFAVFGATAGLTNVVGEQTLGKYVINLPAVQKAFWIVFIASIGICAVCTVVAVVKNIINAKGGEPKSHVRTIGNERKTVQKYLKRERSTQL